MTQEDKLFLLKDLCARLPYGVICSTPQGNGHLCSINQTIFGNEYGVNIEATKRDYFNDNEYEIKPYLRPLSSMTEEEERELISYGFIRYDEDFDNCDDSFEYRTYIDKHNVVNCYKLLISRHFDINGLIPKGLAFEAPDGMYNSNKK